MKIRYKIISVLSFAAMLLPVVASAHALPVNSTPESSATLDAVPQSVIIHFSEHLDASASSITVIGPSGNTISDGTARASEDRYVLSVPIKSDGNGTYIVAWSAVSADDGHFTKGGYPFAVGVGFVIDSGAAASAEIVQITTAPEALGMTVELMGHGFLWAALLLLAFAVRPILATNKFESDASLIGKIYKRFIYLGAFLAVSGGVTQILLKTGDLASLRTISFPEALPLYISTAAGTATACRIVSVLVFIGIFLLGRKVILAARKLTIYDIGLFLTLCCFAYFRAKISHATSNPFHPGFSIAVNFLHVIEKDIWAGIAGMLLIFSIIPRLRGFFAALIPRAFAMIAIDFGAVAVTACYIVWLHLKTFDNLFSTQWGAAFLELFLSAILLVTIRFYHVGARLWRPRFFANLLPSTLAAEFALGIFVVYFSSVVIITSPPLLQPPTPVFAATDQGSHITLEKNHYEDGMLLLTASGINVSTTSDSVLTVEDESGSTGPISVGLSKRFIGGYVFAEGLLSGIGPFKVAITVPQNKAFDAHATFEVTKDAFRITPGWEAKRSFDSFTLMLILFAIAASIAAVGLFYASRLETEAFMPSGRREFAGFIALLTFLMVSFGASSLIGAFHGSSLENPFRAECERDGNMWHLMQPMKAGVQTSPIPTEGCMWGMGNAMYLFPEKNEYDFSKNFGDAVVTLDTEPKELIAGMPSVLTVSLKNSDGTPANLFIDMEKILHVVIISKDQSVFAHIHADDHHQITKSEIDSSTFTLDYTFPRSGDYLVSFDYAHGVSLESKQFTVHVKGSPSQGATVMHQSPGIFGGYNVKLDYSQPFAGEVETMRYTITKDGKPVVLVPYLSAAMHVAVVKNDFSWYLHAHGEVHPPGVPYPPIIVKDGKVIHTMAMMMTPDTFTLPVDAHMIFPSPGLYTVWGQFKTQSGDLVPTAFTVRVE